MSISMRLQPLLLCRQIAKAKDAYHSGYQAGYASGKQDGYAKGYNDGATASQGNAIEFLSAGI